MANDKVATQEELTEQIKEQLSGIPADAGGPNPPDIDLSEFMTIGGSNTQYTTEVLEKKEEIPSTINVDQYKGLIDYVLGVQQRPQFADTMLTQLSEKYEELVKITVALNMLQLPKLYDYLRVLQETLLDPNNIKNMTYADMSTEATNLVKQINETLSMSIKVATQLSTENRVPTKYEKIVNMIMSSSESTIDRIVEVLEDAQE